MENSMVSKLEEMAAKRKVEVYVQVHDNIIVNNDEGKSKTALYAIGGTIVAAILGLGIMFKTPEVQPADPLIAYAEAMTTPTPEITRDGRYTVHTTMNDVRFYFTPEKIGGKDISELMLEKAKYIHSERAFISRRDRTATQGLTDVIEEIYTAADTTRRTHHGAEDAHHVLTKEEVRKYLDRH